MTEEGGEREREGGRKGKMCMSHKEERKREERRKSREIMTTGETKENGR